MRKRTSSWDYHFFLAVRYLRDGHLSMASSAARSALHIALGVINANTPETSFGGPFTKRAAWVERVTEINDFIGYCELEIAENVARIARKEEQREWSRRGYLAPTSP